MRKERLSDGAAAYGADGCCRIRRGSRRAAAFIEFARVCPTCGLRVMIGSHRHTLDKQRMARSDPRSKIATGSYVRQAGLGNPKTARPG